MKTVKSHDRGRIYYISNALPDTYMLGIIGKHDTSSALCAFEECDASATQAAVREVVARTEETLTRLHGLRQGAGDWGRYEIGLW